MIAKISKGSGFGGAVLYALDESKKNEKIVQVLDVNGLYMDIDSFNDRSEKKDDEEEADGNLDADTGLVVEEMSEELVEETKDSEDTHDVVHEVVPGQEDKNLPPVTAALAADFNLQASMNPKVTVPVRDIVLSYSPKDLPKLNDATMLRDAKNYLKGMGYDNTQYLIVRHLERDNPHVHIVANAVDFDGNKIPDKFDREKSTKICKEITLANGYTWGEHKCLSDAQDIHNPIDQIKYDLSRKIVTAIEKTASITFLPEKLAQMGVGCQIKTDNKGLPVGISFSVQAPDKKGNMREYKFAGSKIDSMFSAKNIAVACELHQHMPGLVKCAYAMATDYESCPGLFPKAEKEYDILKKILSHECRERKRIEYQYKDSKKKGIAAVILTLVLGPPFAVAIPAMYLTMRQYQFEHEYAKASKSIEITLKQVRAAKRVMNIINNPEIKHRTYPPFIGTKPDKQIHPDIETPLQERKHVHHMKMR